MSQMTERSRQFRSAIVSFIDERRVNKLKTTKEGEQEQVAAKYEYVAWLADAARRAPQIQAVTHVLKATHPDARGYSLYAVANDLPSHEEVGSHLLGSRQVDDVVGNAAALDVYKFLKLEVEGQRLLDWLQSNDVDLLTALSDDTAVAQKLAEAFKGLVHKDEKPSSHQMAKQLYWCTTDEPVDDAGYHLLQPLFPSSFTQVVHEEMQDARFGEVNKKAREARRDKKPHAEAYRWYPDLAVRKLGGTKPQNISQLNSERGGLNYLLASLPPSWGKGQPKQFLSIDSALNRFRRYEGVGSLLSELLVLLKDEDARPVMETRLKRERIEKALGQSLAAFGVEARETFAPGWSRDESCRLPLYEQIWLDTKRVDLPIREDHTGDDEAFVDAWEWKDWPDEVAHDFGNWLNDILRKAGLPVGDAEHAHWAKQALVEVNWSTNLQRRARTTTEDVEHG